MTPYTSLDVQRKFDECDVISRFGKFVIKMRKKKEKKANLFLSSYDKRYGILTFNHNYHCVVNIQAGKMKLKLNEHIYIRARDINFTLIGKEETERNALNEAVEIAENLERLGMIATVHGISIKEAKDGIRHYDEQIEIMRKEHGISLTPELKPSNLEIKTTETPKIETPSEKLINPWDTDIPKYDNLILGGRR